MISQGYIKAVPRNPYNNMAAVGAYPGSDPANDGWHWGADANGVWFLGATNYDESTDPADPNHGKITPGVE